MPPADARAERWRSRRARRLAGLGWVRREDRADGTPVRFVADELLVLDDHFATARQAFVEQGFTVRDIVEEGDGPVGVRGGGAARPGRRARRVGGARPGRGGRRHQGGRRAQSRVRIDAVRARGAVWPAAADGTRPPHGP